MKKFEKLKIETNSLSNFYSEFIWLAFDLEYTSKIFIRKFKHKWMPRLQAQLHSQAKLSTWILVLEKYCLSIYEQVQVTNMIRDITKPLWSALILAHFNFSIKSYLLAIIETHVNFSFSHFSSSIAL